MRVLVIGAGGMLGRKLVERLARGGLLRAERISELLLVDVVAVTRSILNQR
jgi:nucleoside-diphosphate-sugar epimerase